MFRFTMVHGRNGEQILKHRSPLLKLRSHDFVIILRSPLFTCYVGLIEKVISTFLVILVKVVVEYCPTSFTGSDGYKQVISFDYVLAQNGWLVIRLTDSNNKDLLRQEKKQVDIPDAKQIQLFTDRSRFVGV